MDVYQGRFQDNGFSGYVLKPEFLRNEQTTFNPKSITEGTWATKKKLLLKVRIEVGKCLSSTHLRGCVCVCRFYLLLLLVPPGQCYPNRTHFPLLGSLLQSCMGSHPPGTYSRV